MQRLLRMAVLLPTFALLPILAIAQDTKKDAKDPKDTAALDEAQARKSAVKSGYVQGKLTAYDLAANSFTVQYVYQKKAPTPNPQVKAEIAKLTAEYRQALQAKDKNKAMQIYEQGVDANARLYDITEIPVTFDFVGSKDIAYRTLEIPLDDNGKPKVLSAAEKKELGVDAKLPGVLIDPKKLDVDLVVRVYFDNSKPIPDLTKKTETGKEMKKTEEKKVEEKKPEEKKPEEKKPTVKVITTGGDKKTEPKPEEKKPEAKPAEKTAEKPGEKMEMDKLVYPANMIVVVPTMPGGGAGGGAGANPFIKK
jgi:hypothetical protein